MIPAASFAIGRHMHRLFVAIRPPADICERLLRTMGGISGARWQTEDRLHLTVRFIGEVDRHQAGDAHAALGAIHHRSFELALNGLGLFDKRGVPETVWAGVTPHEPLLSLHNKVDQALLRIGLAPDQRAFLPHITLARLKRSSGTVRDLLESSGGLTSPPFKVESFALFESHLTPEGPIYTPIETYKLGG